MSDKENIEDQEMGEEPQKDLPAQGSHDEDFIEHEWIGEDEWADEEVEEDVLVEEEAPNFIDNGDGTVSDTRHNLMWQKKDSYAEFGYGINWFEAHDYCDQVNEQKLAGYDDWRLASLEEAKSMFSFAQSNSDKDGAEIQIDSVFEPGGGHNTWTFEEKPDYHQYADKFSYVTGNEVWEHKDNEYSHVRLVREIARDEWEPEWRKDSKTFER